MPQIPGMQIKTINEKKFKKNNSRQFNSYIIKEFY